MGLGHADRLGWIFVRQHLSAAKVVSSKDDPINKIFRLAGTWNYAAKQRALALIEKHRNVMQRLIKTMKRKNIV